MSKKSDAHEALTRLLDVHVEDISVGPPDEVLSEALEGGVDLIAQKARVMDLLRLAEGKVGRARMDSARAAVEARRLNPVAVGTTRAMVADQTRELTLAARNGTSQSERDKETLQDDLDELANFVPGEGPN
jgi:hypothetical protein